MYSWWDYPTYRLPESLWEKAKIQATMERVSFTEIVRRALTEYLAKKESKKKGGK